MTSNTMAKQGLKDILGSTLQEQLAPTRSLSQPQKTEAPLKSGVSKREVATTAEKSKYEKYSQDIQAFLTGSKGQSHLEKPRNAVIEMIKNGEDEEFISNAINEKILPKYKPGNVKNALAGAAAGLVKLPADIAGTAMRANEVMKNPFSAIPMGLDAMSKTFGTVGNMAGGKTGEELASYGKATSSLSDFLAKGLGMGNTMKQIDMVGKLGDLAGDMAGTAVAYNPDKSSKSYIAGEIGTAVGTSFFAPSIGSTKRIATNSMEQLANPSKVGELVDFAAKQADTVAPATDMSLKGIAKRSVLKATSPIWKPFYKTAEKYKAELNPSAVESIAKGTDGHIVPFRQGKELFAHVSPINQESRRKIEDQLFSLGGYKTDKTKPLDIVSKKQNIGRMLDVVQKHSGNGFSEDAQTFMQNYSRTLEDLTQASADDAMNAGTSLTKKEFEHYFKQAVNDSKLSQVAGETEEANAILKKQLDNIEKAGGTVSPDEVTKLLKRMGAAYSPTSSMSEVEQKISQQMFKSISDRVAADAVDIGIDLSNKRDLAVLMDGLEFFSNLGKKAGIVKNTGMIETTTNAFIGINTIKALMMDPKAISDLGTAATIGLFQKMRRKSMDINEIFKGIGNVYKNTGKEIPDDVQIAIDKYNMSQMQQRAERAMKNVPKEAPAPSGNLVGVPSTGTKGEQQLNEFFGGMAKSERAAANKATNLEINRKKEILKSKYPNAKTLLVPKK